MDVDAVYKPTNIAKGHHLAVCWWNMANPHIPICHTTIIVSLVCIPFLLETVVLTGKIRGFEFCMKKHFNDFHVLSLYSFVCIMHCTILQYIALNAFFLS